MFGLRLTIDCAPRTKNGQPAQSTTGSDSTSSIQLCVAMSNQPSRWPNIASTVTTTVSGSVHQKRRRKSTSSGFSLVVEARHLRLERHAALRAGARMVLPDLRVHRAGVDRCRLRLAAATRAARWAQVLRRVGGELRAAARAAEAVRAALVLVPMRRLFGDRHAAHRVLQRRRRLRRGRAMHRRVNLVVRAGGPGCHGLTE